MIWTIGNYQLLKSHMTLYHSFISTLDKVLENHAGVRTTTSETNTPETTSLGITTPGHLPTKITHGQLPPRQLFSTTETATSEDNYPIG